MTNYRIVNQEGVSQLYPDLIAIAKQASERDAFIDAQSQAQPIKAYWSEMSGITEVSGELGDITKQVMGELVLSPKAHQVLSEQLSDYGEFLPIKHNDETWYYFNPLNAIDADEAQSVKNEFDEVEALAFDEAATKDQLVWVSHFTACADLYCTDKFVELVEANQLTGIEFTEELAE